MTKIDNPQPKFMLLLTWLLEQVGGHLGTPMPHLKFCWSDLETDCWHRHLLRLNWGQTRDHWDLWCCYLIKFHIESIHTYVVTYTRKFSIYRVFKLALTYFKPTIFFRVEWYSEQKPSCISLISWPQLSSQDFKNEWFLLWISFYPNKLLVWTWSRSKQV